MLRRRSVRIFLGTTSACTKCITTAHASSAEYCPASIAKAATTTNHINECTTMSHAYSNNWCNRESPLSNRLCIRKILVGISKLVAIATFRWHRNEHVSGIGVGIPSIEHQHRNTWVTNHFFISVSFCHPASHQHRYP